ncbi:MAG: cation/H(+) antiporter [Blastocatellia bacterium AA13]|nr:MAG: cation/H(+) antiporter [Blastocatellia bacterium AA13]
MSEQDSNGRKPILLYFVLLAVFGAGLWFILNSGSKLKRDDISSPPSIQAQSNEQDPAAPAQPAPSTRGLGSVLIENARGSLSVLLLQIIVIIFAARVFGRLFLKINQPPVMGEMFAGIVLGPSVLGAISPGTVAFLFPDSSMGTLRLLSQIGVILFMFVVGLELNAGHVRDKAHAAIMVSHGSIIIPFFLGAALSLVIYLPLASPSTTFNAFALFMGIAMSITAFPVLARIIEERGMTQSYLGSTALACAAVDDVTAWCILAVVIAIVQANGLLSSVFTIGLVLLFIGSMLFVVKPRLGRLLRQDGENEWRSAGIVAGVFAFVLASAWFTEIIGIHALFGAFFAGVIMPTASGFRSFLKEKLETFSSSALLPLFFAFTGLRTQINLLNDMNSWLLCAAIIGVAVVGKLGGSMLMARSTGMNWHDSFSIGILMNTRGLMELVVLNIGYDLGILPARIFAIMVLMALATTSMAGPLLSWIKLKEARVLQAASAS